MSWAIVAVGAGAAISGAGTYLASQGSGESRSMSELSGLPYKQQLKMAEAQAKLQRDYNRRTIEDAMSYAPQLAQAQVAANARLLKAYPQLALRERMGTSAQRAGDLGDLQRLGADYAAGLGDVSSAYRGLGDAVNAGPGSELLDYLNGQAMGSPLYDELQRQALADLQLGGTLSPEEQRMIEQQTRAVYGDRGLGMSNPAIAAEFLNRDLYSRARLNERRQFGVQTEQLGLQRGQFGLGVAGAQEANTGNWRNFLTTASQAQLQPVLGYLQSRTNVSPLQYIGMGASAPSAVNAAQITTTAPSIAQAANSLTPLYNYAADVYGTNFNAAESRAQNAASGVSSMGSGLMGVGGSAYVNRGSYYG
jgi:hypothetical protein